MTLGELGAHHCKTEGPITAKHRNPLTGRTATAWARWADMDEKKALLEQAERCRRIAEPTSVAALPDPEQAAGATALAGAHESALTILREFEAARRICSAKSWCSQTAK